MHQLRMDYITFVLRKFVLITVCMTTLAATISSKLPGHKTMIACVPVYFKKSFLSGICILNGRFGTARRGVVEKRKQRRRKQVDDRLSKIEDRRKGWI